MTQYLLVLEQEEDGCDYCIGCGITYEIFNASSFEEAQRKAKHFWLGEDFINSKGEESPRYWGGETNVRRVYLTQLLEQCKTEQWIDEVENFEAKLQELQDQERELAELKRLQEKYKNLRRK